MIGRVSDRGSFAALRTNGVRASSGPLTVVFAEDPRDTSVATGQAMARVAFGVSRRVGKAVDRNKVRRRLRAILSDASAEALPPGVYLVITRPGITELTFPELREHVHRALHDTARRAVRRAAAGGRASDGTSARVRP